MRKIPTEAWNRHNCADLEIAYIDRNRVEKIPIPNKRRCRDNLQHSAIVHKRLDVRSLKSHTACDKISTVSHKKSYRHCDEQFHHFVIPKTIVGHARHSIRRWVLTVMITRINYYGKVGRRTFIRVASCESAFFPFQLVLMVNIATF